MTSTNSGTNCRRCGLVDVCTVGERQFEKGTKAANVGEAKNKDKRSGSRNNVLLVEITL